MMRQRLHNLRKAFPTYGGNAFVSFDPVTNEYLSGFRGTTSAVIVTAQEAFLLVDFRYIEQAGKQACPDWQVVEISGIPEHRTGEWLNKLHADVILYEPDRITVNRMNLLDSMADGRLKQAPALVSGLREFKDAEELVRLRRAGKVGETALMNTIQQTHEGMTEQEFAARLEYEFKRLGAQRTSFDSIVLFGARSSLPHGMPGDTPLREGDILLVDCGCMVDGYCSDLTRTFIFGRICDTWFEEIYECVREAQLAALQSVRAGVRAVDVDAIARDIITKAGYGERFGHGVGHGVGLEIHENPRLNTQSTAILAAGMVVTVEPGIYLPGKGGVRIEDLLVVTEDGYELLTTLPKELQVLKP